MSNLAAFLLVGACIGVLLYVVLDMLIEDFSE
jgi:hypothetical protein